MSAPLCRKALIDVGRGCVESARRNCADQIFHIDAPTERANDPLDRPVLRQKGKAHLTYAKQPGAVDGMAHQSMGW